MATKNSDTLKVELLVEDDKADVVIGKAKQKLQDFVKDAERLQPQISFRINNDAYINLDNITKKADETRKRFAEIATVRLDNGQIGAFSREIVVAQQRSQQLSADLTNLRKELMNPARGSSIKFLTDEIRGAEMELANLNRKLATVGSNAAVARPTAENLKLTSFQKQNLSYQVNDIATMAAMGANPTQILASQGGQIAQIFNPAQIAAFTAAYSGLVGILGAGAVAIGLTYKITSDIRAESERLLKVQESITGAMNKQLISQAEGLRNLQKMRETAENGRQFDRYLSGASEEQLRNNRATLEKLSKITPATIDGKPNEEFTKIQSKLLSMDAELDAIRQQKAKLTDNSFNQRWESYIKSQERMREIEQRNAELFAQSVEKGKAKVKELEKTYNSLFDGIYKRTNSNNPFVLLFSEAEESMKKLRQSSQGLSNDIVSQFEKMERAQNRLRLFDTRLENNLNSFGLREDARSFRNPLENPEIERKRRDEFVKRQIGFGNNYASDLANKAGGFDKLSDAQKRSIYETTLLQNTSELNRQSLITGLAFDRNRNQNENLTFNERLEKQLKIIEQSKFGFGAEVDPLADRKIIALTNGQDPNQLSSRVREAAASAREREATRLESAEKDAVKARNEQIELQKKLLGEVQKLNSIAEKEGFKAVIEILDKSNGAANVLGAAPTNADVQNQFFNQ